MENTIGLRVDVDFEIGLTKGVPFLLDFFSGHGMKATFYVTMGRDGFWRSWERFGTAGYAGRVFAFNPFNMAARFGLSYLTAHMLGRPGRVGADHAAVLRDITAGGHEIGLHGYDHFWWAENIWRCGPDEIRKDMETGIEVFTSTIGSQPKTWAAPNWRSSSDSLRLMDGYGFSYASDCRGKGPFFPAEDGWRSGTLQLPVNLPCLHEIRRYLKTGRREAVIEEFLSRLESGFNVWCVHDYYEGILERGLFSALAERLIRDGFRFAALRDLAGAIDLKAVPSCGIAKKEIPGGRGMVSCQKI